MNRSDAMSPTMAKEASVKISSKNVSALGGHLQGKLLTIVDASIADPIQRDALKNVVNQALWEDMGKVISWMAEQDDKKGLGSGFPF